MGGNNSKLESHEKNYKFEFDMNILVCGDYDQDNLEEKFTSTFKEVQSQKYILEAKHKIIKDWNFFVFKKSNPEIGKDVYEFIKNKFEEKNGEKNAIIYYVDENANSLINYFDENNKNYCPLFLFISDDNFNYSYINNIDKDSINVIKKNDNNNEGEIMKYLIEFCGYYNEFGHEFLYPKKLMNNNLMSNDIKIILEHSFTFNILVVGRPGCGKSTFINKILHQKICKAMDGVDSCSKKITKYYHKDKNIAFYDTPGLSDENEVNTVMTLIKEKKERMREEKNKIHAIFYLIDRQSSRVPYGKEKDLIKFFFEENYIIYFIFTKTHNKEDGDSFKVNFKKSFNFIFPNIEYNLDDHIFYVNVLDNDKYFPKCNVDILFNKVYKENEKYICNEEINAHNFSEIIKNTLLNNLNSLSEIKFHLRALAEHTTFIYRILGYSIGFSDKGSTNISTDLIKLLSKLYMDEKSTQQCREMIEHFGYTNEYSNSDTAWRFIEKCFAWIFYKSPAEKEVKWIGNECINQFEKKFLEDENNQLKYIRQLIQNMNKAINDLNTIE